jgi:anthranilate synthase component II
VSKILILDNYDSFTYNLVQMVENIMKEKVAVFRNDEISLDQVDGFDKIILSPGPGIPNEAGILLPLIKQYAASKSILGVCLGHQAIGEAFGGRLTNLTRVFHGVATKIKLKNDLEKSAFNNDWFKGLDNEIEVGRYHSWVIDKEEFPKELEVTSWDENGMIMSLKHHVYDVQGVQFHPESLLTPLGKTMVENWLNPCQDF